MEPSGSKGSDGREPNESHEPQGLHRCSCGFEAGSLTDLEDHLFVFPEEDEHYELANGCQPGAQP